MVLVFLWFSMWTKIKTNCICLSVLEARISTLAFTEICTTERSRWFKGTLNGHAIVNRILSLQRPSTGAAVAHETSEGKGAFLLLEEEGKARFLLECLWPLLEINHTEHTNYLLYGRIYLRFIIYQTVTVEFMNNKTVLKINEGFLSLSY